MFDTVSSSLAGLKHLVIVDICYMHTSFQKGKRVEAWRGYAGFYLIVAGKLGIKGEGSLPVLLGRALISLIISRGPVCICGRFSLMLLFDLPNISPPKLIGSSG